MRRATLAALLLTSIMIGCSNAPNEAPADGVTLTVVGADGATTLTLTGDQAAAQTAELERLKAAAAVGAEAGRNRDALPEFVRDAGCGGTSLWLYDQPNQMGNRICFVDIPNVTATADLLQYAYPGGGTWAGNERSASGMVSRVKSYWGGRQAALGACQDSVGHTPVACYASPVFEIMPAFARGNIGSNLRSVTEYHPIE
jgi:hypothetical protein